MFQVTQVINFNTYENRKSADRLVVEITYRNMVIGKEYQNSTPTGGAGAIADAC